MPEGPEVKIMSDYLNEVLDGHVIIAIDCISTPYQFKYGALVEDLRNFLPYHFTPSFCLGKSTFIKLSSTFYFSYHLGMTGYWSTEKSNHAHLCLTTDTGLFFYFHDTRRFGNIKLLDSSSFPGNEFFNGDFLNYDIDLVAYAKFLKANLITTKEVCKVLLDQRYFCGVGNYLKSEILFVSNIHPHQLWSKLSFDDILNLCKMTKLMLLKSYKCGGAQLRDFKNPSKAPDLDLLVYGKSFTKDNLPVKSEVTKDNRRTFWCPSVQSI